AAYKYGQVAFLDAFLNARDFSELVTTGYYVSSVLDQDRRIVGTIDDLVTQVSAEQRAAAGLRTQARDQEGAALAAREQVAAITAQQRSLAEAARTQQLQRAALMSRLEAEGDRLEAVEAELEAESQRLAEELARSRWRAGAPGQGELVWPTNGRVGSGYGWRTHPISGQRRLHTGVDVSGPTGQPIYAAAEGLVVHAGWRGGYGLAVVIDHGGGLATLYAHNSRLLVTEGMVVSAGQQISAMGTTGYSTGPHLHFEVRVDGQPRDPMEWY
ncbi:MAG TPA: M23 family metallopeptidase, partial [Nitriliruptorales bacterium]